MRPICWRQVHLKLFQLFATRLESAQHWMDFGRRDIYRAWDAHYEEFDTNTAQEVSARAADRLVDLLHLPAAVLLVHHWSRLGNALDQEVPVVSVLLRLPKSRSNMELWSLVALLHQELFHVGPALYKHGADQSARNSWNCKVFPSDVHLVGHRHLRRWKRHGDSCPVKQLKRRTGLSFTNLLGQNRHADLQCDAVQEVFGRRYIVWGLRG